MLITVSQKYIGKYFQMCDVYRGLHTIAQFVFIYVGDFPLDEVVVFSGL